jgi:hypothetical protein
MALYAAADLPLPEIATTGTSPRPLGVRPITRDEERVRERFLKRHVYFLAADTGCSCGFSYDSPEDGSNEHRESVRQLRVWLTDAVERAGPVELYACWSGDEGEPPLEQVRVTPSYFAGDAEVFELPERWLATVVAVEAPARGAE